MPEVTGINPRHFLGGGMCREEATSAFLATLLDQSVEFRQRFFQLCKIPMFDVKDVVVEQAQRDVTIIGEDTTVIIENKIDAGSKTDGQLLGYYRRVKEESDGHRVHSVYLAPSSQLGESEVSQIEPDSGEVAIAIAWLDVAPLCHSLGDFDNQFAESGVACVLEAINRRKLRSSREWEEDELILRDMVRAMMPSLQSTMPHCKLTIYACQLWSSSSVTFVVDLKMADRTDGTPEIGVEVTYSFNASTKRHDDLPYAKHWIAPIKDAGSWNSYRIDDDRKWMQVTESMRGEPARLQNEIAHRFEQLAGEIDQAVADVKASADAMD